MLTPHSSKTLFVSRQPYWILTLAIGLCLASAFLSPQSAHAAGTTYYVNCANSSNGTGTLSSPWNALSSVNAKTFSPGDAIVFQRGTTCSGMLAPKGSGTNGNPITISAYGTTGSANPVINGGTGSANPAAVKLNNQQYWVVENLEVKGGYYRNVWITANQANATFSYFRLTNLLVHDNGDLMNNFWRTGTGGVIVEPCNSTTTLKDIVLSNITAYHEHQSGIQIGYYDLASSSTRGNAPDCSMGLNGKQPSNTLVQNATVQNSISHSNDADGLEAFASTAVTLQNNVFYDNGNGAGGAGVSLNGEGAWWDNTNGVTAQFNEAYGNHTGKGDGGGLDNDMNTYNNLVQYNYLHHNDSYCVSAFSAAHENKTNTIIRDNICSNNGQNKSHASSGDIYIHNLSSTGSFSGLQVYNNTFTRSTTSGPAIDAAAPFSGMNIFENNIVYHPSGVMLNATSTGLTADYNLYWSSTSSGSFTYNNVSYSSFNSYKSGSRQDSHSNYADPRLNSPNYDTNRMPAAPTFTLQSGSPAIGAGILISANGGRDFFGNPVSASSRPNIGAYN